MTQEEYKEKRRKIVRESQRRRRERAREQGLCPICMKNLPEIGYGTCRECRIRISKYHERKKGERL